MIQRSSRHTCYIHQQASYHPIKDRPSPSSQACSSLYLLATLSLKYALFILIATLLSLPVMTNMFSRLLRPFHTSSTMSFSADTASSLPAGAQHATFAAGCFWGVEHLFRHNFAHDAVLEAKVGYIGGDTSSPSYRAVCTGRTGHAEALQMTFDPTKVSYTQLVEFFYRMHDPTTKDRQGPDAGTQYRSGIFTHGQEQEETAREVTRKVQEQWWTGGKVVTEILPAGQWWNAEDYHQLYLDKNPGGYECPSHFLRKFAPLK